MKHETEKYGMECNHIVCTLEESYIIRSFLERIGVEVRYIMWSTDECVIEARNPYMDNCFAHSDRLASEIIKESEDQISDGLWRR